MKRALYWFRNNLRLRDNPSLNRALQENDEIIPVYVINDGLFKQNPLGFENCGRFRMKFLFETISQLKSSIEQLGGKLLVLKGDPVEQLIKLCSQFDIDTLYASRELDYDELKQEATLNEKLQLVLEYDHLLLDPNQLPFPAKEAPLVFTNFRKAVEKKMNVRAILPEPKKICTPDTSSIAEFDFQIPEGNIDDRSAFPFEGGEVAGWQRLNHYLWQSDQVRNYKFTRNQLLGTEYSSKFSPYLAVGALSPVSIYHEVKRYEHNRKKNISTYWLIFEMLWREFFKLQSYRHGSAIFKSGGLLSKQTKFERDGERFNLWMAGKTDDDFVNTNMIELRETGFMSNRGRQNAASFLVHDMQIDWRWGASYFESQLVDYDCASNWCNWNYVAGVGNDPRQRKFDTVWQANKYDAKGLYRTKWLTHYAHDRQTQLFE